MNSVQKTWEMVEKFQSATDAELEEAIGMPAPIVRMALAAFSGRMPDDPDELDGFLGRLIGFLEQLQSDPVTA